MPNLLVTTYDPKKVVVSFGGVPLSGYAEGTFISIAANDGDGFKKHVGADGEVNRAKSNDNTHEVTITLLQSSQYNDYLSEVRNKDKQDGNNILPLEISESNGDSLHSWPQAWVHGDPSWEYANDSGERTWVISTGQQESDTKNGLHE